MKKIYAIIVIMLLFAGAYAQTSDSRASSTKIHPVAVTNSSPLLKHHELQKSIVPAFWINIDSADAYYAGINGLGYSRFTWHANQHYQESDTSAGHYGLQKDFYVVFDTIV